MNTREKGTDGENQACEHLIALGYKVISRNYQSNSGEIDIVAEGPDGTIAFVEVKSGGSSFGGHPFFRVTRGKQQTMIRMAKLYLADHGLSGRPCRFDVIAVFESGKIDHLRNAFLT